VPSPGPTGKAVETAPMAAGVTSCERIIALPVGVGCCTLFGLQLDNATPQNTLGLEVWQQVAVYQRQGTTTPLNKNLKGEEVIASIFHKERNFDEVYFKKKRNRRKE
jgi:hypothetical protein